MLLCLFLRIQLSELLVVVHRSAENDCSALLKTKNQLALDLERLLSHKEVSRCDFVPLFTSRMYVDKLRELQLLGATICCLSALVLLVGRQERHPACKKSEWWDAGVVICLERGADLQAAQLMPLPLTVSCVSEIQTGFTFLVPAHPGSPGQRAVKWVCVCVGLRFECALH